MDAVDPDLVDSIDGELRATPGLPLSGGALVHADTYEHKGTDYHEVGPPCPLMRSSMQRRLAALDTRATRSLGPPSGWGSAQPSSCAVPISTVPARKDV